MVVLYHLFIVGNIASALGIFLHAQIHAAISLSMAIVLIFC